MSDIFTTNEGFFIYTRILSHLRCLNVFYLTLKGGWLGETLADVLACCSTSSHCFVFYELWLHLWLDTIMNKSPIHLTCMSLDCQWKPIQICRNMRTQHKRPGLSTYRSNPRLSCCEVAGLLTYVSDTVLLLFICLFHCHLGIFFLFWNPIALLYLLFYLNCSLSSSFHSIQSV